MNSLMEYRGYHANIRFSSEDNSLYGRIIGINDVIVFGGNSVAEVEQQFHIAVDEYLEDCAATGKDPNKEFKGSFNVRLGEERHKRAALAAEYENKTLNQLVCDAVENYCDSILMN